MKGNHDHAKKPGAHTEYRANQDLKDDKVKC